MSGNQERHRLTAADILTLLRIAGTILLLGIQPFSAVFFLLYALTGLTDVLDGWIARKTKTVSDFGARLDSAADLLFYAVILFRIFPALWNTLPGSIWYAVAGIVMVRISAYLIAMVKYRLFVSLHTYLNKFTGIAVFLIPFVLITDYAVVFCWITCAVAMASAFEELGISLQSKTYCPNTKSIFHK
ncbi:MAG: CDP-alcohol phosphatidyltransferase family protein [Faecalibacterium sp.]